MHEEIGPLVKSSMINLVFVNHKVITYALGHFFESIDRALPNVWVIAV